MNVSSWLNDTVTVKHRTGVSAGGNPTYATASDVPARVTRKTKTVLSSTGEQVEASHHITVLAEVEEEDQLQLAGESFYRRAVAIDEGKDKGGNVTHYEVWL